MADNISKDVSWLDKGIKRFKDTGAVIPPMQKKIYEAVRDAVVGGRTVLDVGCSIGVGANILSHDARHVWGVDVNEEAINYARYMFERPNLSFEVLDVENPPTRELAKFEIIVCIEVLEHLSNIEKGLNTIKRFFTNDTIAFLTIPNINNADIKERDDKNELHLTHWTAGDFYGLLIKHFKAVTLFSADKISTFEIEETVDGNSTDSIIVAKVEGIL